MKSGHCPCRTQTKDRVAYNSRSRRPNGQLQRFQRVLICHRLHIALPALAQRLGYNNHQRQYQHHKKKDHGNPDKDPFHRPGSLLLFFIHYASLPLIRFVFLACTRFTPNRIRNDTASVTSAIAVALS